MDRMKQGTLHAIMCQKSGTYKQLNEENPVIYQNSIIVVTKCPWYKSWFGLKPTRLKIGDGVTPFNKLKWI